MEQEIIDLISKLNLTLDEIKPMLVTKSYSDAFADFFWIVFWYIATIAVPKNMAATELDEDHFFRSSNEIWRRYSKYLGYFIIGLLIHGIFDKLMNPVFYSLRLLT